MKRPTLKQFKEALKRTGGNLSKVAEIFGVSRTCVTLWKIKIPEFAEAIEEARANTFDKLLISAEILAQGIPQLEDGKIVGWIERPDSRMLAYLLGRLGKNEGFGDSLDITTNGKEISVLPKLTPDDIEELKKLNGL